MTPETIAQLLEACKNAGVSKFKFEKLEVHFHTPQDIPQQWAAPAEATLPLADRAIEEEIEEDADLRDLALQNLLIENPLAYEAAMRKSGNGAFDNGSE